MNCVNCQIPAISRKLCGPARLYYPEARSAASCSKATLNEELCSNINSNLFYDMYNIYKSLCTLCLYVYV